jgi:D-beta-D-heptose 7-phosphate kinase/D-beta-D-heptose 1-phosphate adenosyltransferase
VEAAARELIAAHGFEFVVATRSEKGMSVIDPAAAHHISTQAREVFDVSGAGDTVIATLGALLAAGAPVADAMAIANEAAGVVVGKLGTAVAEPDELR